MNSGLQAYFEQALPDLCADCFASIDFDLAFTAWYQQTSRTEYEQRQ